MGNQCVEQGAMDVPEKSVSLQTKDIILEGVEYHVQASESDDRFTLLNLDSVREDHVTDLELIVRDHPSRTPQYVRSNYGSSYMLHSYDVFISHRWHNDDEVVDQLYDAFLGHVVGSEMRAVKVFYDKIRLKECQHFQKAFGKALIHSTILVPIIFTKALQNILAHDETCEDNVLIEWMLALECMQDPIHSKIRMIYPLMFGERNSDGSVGDLFAEEIFDRLPDIIPTASIEVVRKLLEENGFTVSSTLATRTVRGVVTEISKYIGLKAWEYPNTFVRAASTSIVNLVKECLEKVHNNSHYDIYNKGNFDDENKYVGHSENKYAGESDNDKLRHSDNENVGHSDHDILGQSDSVLTMQVCTEIIILNLSSDVV